MSESGNNSQQSAESLLSEELSSYCNSNSLSKEGLQEIIERHDYKSRQLSDYKFFLWACINKRVNEGIIQCLLEYFPVAISATSYFGGQTPLHYACYNPHMTLNIIQLLVDAAPNSVSHADNNGETPLHRLSNYVLDDTKAIKILKLLIEKCPEAVRHANNGGVLPIHIAGGWGRRSTEFCSVLIEAYPGSQRMTDANGLLPLHYACADNTLATVEYFYKLYPDAINHAATNGAYPIHNAILGVIKKTKGFSPSDRLDIVKFLLDSDPNVTLQKVDGESLLKWACRKRYNDSTIAAALKVIETIYDAHPEAIEENRISSDIQRYHEQVQTFINTHLVYSRQAKNLRLMMTPDSNGRLPLHTALQNNVRLGSIKLLVKGNPLALQTPDNSDALPLHVASQHHSSANVVQYLVGLDTSTLDAVDKEGDTALHYACRGAKYDTIALLLETYDAVSVSKRNAHGKLPIDLLWESSEVLDRESVEYTESVFRLLKAYPEMVMVMNIDMQQQQSAAASCPSQNGKKRKFVMTNER
eukprot:scaffold21178_cov98-Skeletonema_dohrnii-CCMP3373.AAC.9